MKISWFIFRGMIGFCFYFWTVLWSEDDIFNKNQINDLFMDNFPEFLEKKSENYQLGWINSDTYIVKSKGISSQNAVQSKKKIKLESTCMDAARLNSVRTMFIEVLKLQNSDFEYKVFGYRIEMLACSFDYSQSQCECFVKIYKKNLKNEIIYEFR